MTNSYFFKWLRNVSISKKLYFIGGIMAVLIVTELAALMFTVSSLASIRAMMMGEGTWSRAQKDAVSSLQRYGATHREADYLAYQRHLLVPTAYTAVRLEMKKSQPERALLAERLKAASMPERDAERVARFLVRFRSSGRLTNCTAEWDRGDSLLERLQATGSAVRAELQGGAGGQEKVNMLLEGLVPLNRELSEVEASFANCMSHLSHWLSSLVAKLLVALVLSVVGICLALTIFVSRNIARGLNEIRNSARRITKGDYSVRAVAYSRDELGILASSFNVMTEKLETNINELKRQEEELNKSKELAEQSAVIKDHFLANMSHEIRTPMNAVIGFTHLLEHTKLETDQKEFVNAIKIAGQNLLTIINDILDYSKIASGTIVFEQVPFSIKSVFESLDLLLRPKAREKGIVLTFKTDGQVPEKVIGDPTRLNQVLSNLLDNAIKFTEKGSIDVSCRVKYDKDEAATLEFQVRDSGAGIPPEKLAVIFERFTQASAETNRKFGGTGLGLSIVKSLVEMQKGHTSVTSRVGEGSVFTCVIPYRKQKEVVPAAPPPPVAVPDADKRKVKILLAEDNQLNQMLVLHFSRTYGFDTVVADNGLVAVEKLRETPFDIILMDMQMPEMDGYEATTVIRNELKSDIPIIALTAHAMSGEKEKCLSLGMNDFISKPFDPKDLHKKIMHFCESQLS